MNKKYMFMRIKYNQYFHYIDKTSNWDWNVKYNDDFIDYSKIWTLIEYFSLDSKYFITYKPFEIKCYDCNYFYIYNLENKKSVKFSLYWENWEILIIENILWYVINIL